MTLRNPETRQTREFNAVREHKISTLPPPPSARRQRADVVFTETGKLPVKFDYRLDGTVIR